MKYPKDVLTKSKTGKIEARVFIDEGRFVRYGYIDTKTGDKEKKIKICLIKKDGIESYFIIPMRDENKFLMIKDISNKKVKIFKEDEEKIIEVK